MSYLICISYGCCLKTEHVGKVLDHLKALMSILKMCEHRSEVLQTMVKDLEACRNAIVKVLGGIEALNQRLKNVKDPSKLSDVKSLINTVVNILNRLVEVRNLILRVRDEIQDIRDRNTMLASTIPKEADATIGKLLLELDKVLLVALRNSLYLISKIRGIDREDSGKLASAIGTAFFASLLDLYEYGEDIRRVLNECFG